MGEQAVVYYQFKGLGHTFAEIENTKNVRVAKILSNQKKIGVIIVSFNTTSKQDKKHDIANICKHHLTYVNGKAGNQEVGYHGATPKSRVTWRGQSLF